jgi:hypothetical protein
VRSRAAGAVWSRSRRARALHSCGANATPADDALRRRSRVVEERRGARIVSHRRASIGSSIIPRVRGTREGAVVHSSSPNPSPDATGPLPQFSLSDADDSFDRAPTLVRPALDARRAADVLRAIERLPACSPRDSVPPDSLAPVMSTSEVRFFDADAAVAALEEHDEHDELAEAPRRPTIERARVVRRAVIGVLGASLVLLAIAGGVAAARPPAEAVVFESAPVHATPAAAPTHPSEPSAAEERPSSTGVLETPRSLAAKPLFVDGVAMGRAPLTVTCGSHSVRVGEKGASSRVDVPCGGSALVR